MKEYYSYDKDQLLDNGPKLALFCEKDNETVFRKMAAQMIDEICANNEKGKKTVMICPVGPVGQYPYFVQMVNEQGISLKDVWFINMDEYLDDDKNWVPKAHPLSFRGFMDNNVYSRSSTALVMREEGSVFHDQAAWERLQERMGELGGVDIGFGGIGCKGDGACT